MNSPGLNAAFDLRGKGAPWALDDQLELGHPYATHDRPIGVLLIHTVYSGVDACTTQRGAPAS
ncbi:hypothetical protein GCM10022262_06560 [Georgenia daeguensis]|uniref:N-acetylmuramoyl-L-alanine amidase n=1 Tax=Georgenia daeguensis TaxID=908355 RepID=A0ABP8ER84_9MICO